MEHRATHATWGSKSRGSGEGLKRMLFLWALCLYHTAFVPTNRCLSITARPVASFTVSPRFALALTFDQHVMSQRS